MKFVNSQLFTYCIFSKCSYRTFLRHNSWRVLFFGNDAFSLYSLDTLHQLYKGKKLIKKLHVVTTIGKHTNCVKKFADQRDLVVLSWPPNLKCDAQYDVGIVVSFGHLISKMIIDYFPLGMINVHASLLPRWRGASPIIHAILHGESLTGVTIMRINPHHFDTGDIILQKSSHIDKNDLMPTVHKRLGTLGASALIEAISTLPHCLHQSVPQNSDQASKAPRINSSIADVRWSDSTAINVYNKFRALYSIYELRTRWHGVILKLKRLRPANIETVNAGYLKPGTLLWDRNTKELSVVCSQGRVYIDLLSIGGKTLKGVDFYNGYLSKISEKDWILEDYT